MKKLLLDLKYIQIDYWDLTIIILILLFSSFLTYYVRKKITNSERKYTKPLIYVGLWSFTIVLSSLLVIPSLRDLAVIKNDFLILKPLSLAFIFIILFLNYFTLKLLKRWFTKQKIKEKKSPYPLFKIILWFISIHYILKMIIVKYDLFLGLQLIKVKNVAITISDLFFVFITISLTYIGILLLKLWLRRQVERKRIEISTSVALLNISKYFIWVVVIAFLFQSIGFNLSLLLAGSAALLVGIGMGIQQVFNDFASGLILLIERQIKVGDFVQADTVEGTIVEIGFRTAIVLTRDNIRIIIPNSKLVSESVVNWTKGEAFSRFSVDIGVAYGSDTKKVKEILYNCAIKHEKVIKKPKPEVQFVNFGASSLDFKLFFYCSNPFGREFIKSDLRFSIDEEFKKADIKIPFPQMDVHFDKNQ